MVALLAAFLLGISSPPPAYVQPGHVPLAVSSWCWGSRCGAPIASSTKVAVATRGDRVRVELQFEPTQVRIAVGGAPQLALVSGHEVSWRATRGGGITIDATATRGWVIYVGRLTLR